MSRFHALKNVNVVLAFSVKNHSMSDESDECCVSGCGNKENRCNKIWLNILFQETKTEDNSGSAHLALFLLQRRKLMISTLVPNIIY